MASGLFIGPLLTAPLTKLRPWLLIIGMAIQVVGYGSVAVVIAWGFDGWPVVLTVLLAGFGQGIAYPRLFNTTLGDLARSRVGSPPVSRPPPCRSVPRSAWPRLAASSPPRSATGRVPDQLCQPRSTLSGGRTLHITWRRCGNSVQIQLRQPSTKAKATCRSSTSNGAARSVVPRSSR
jgi:hypothetical protein